MDMGNLVARVLLEANGDEIAALQHLLRGLRKTRLVAIHGLQAGKPRQEGRKSDHSEHDDGAGVRRFDKAEHALRERA